MIFFLFVYALSLYGSLIGFEPEYVEKIFESALMAPLEVPKLRHDYSQNNHIFENAMCLVQAHVINETELDAWKTLYTLWYIDLRNKYHISSSLQVNPQNIRYDNLDETLDENAKKTLYQIQASINSSIYFIKRQDENYLRIVSKENKYIYDQFLLWALMEQHGLCQHYKTVYMQNLLSILNELPQGLHTIPSIKNYANFSMLCTPNDFEEENTDDESWYATTESD